MSLVPLTSAELGLIPLPRQLHVHEGTLPGLPAEIDHVLDPTVREEGYRLAVTADGIRIISADERGAVWARQVLRQLVRSDGSLPLVEIEDWPRFPWRGALLDVARHHVDLSTLLRFIDLLALHRFNVLHLHLTDDQGWRVESRRHPTLTSIGAWRPETVHPVYGGDGTPHGGFYTQEQLRHVVAYAAERAITVVPEIDLPGHATALLAALPELAVPGHEFASPATGFGVHDNLVSLLPGTMETVFDVLEEVLEIFPSRWVHIGGDEVPTRQWVASDACQRRARDLGLAGAEELQGWFTREVARWLVDRGRVPIVWDEATETGPVDGALCTAWRNEAHGVRTAGLGMEVIATPAEVTYLDHYPSDLDEEPFCQPGVTTTQEAYAWDPQAAYGPELAGHVIGGQLQVWTEFINTATRIDYQTWPRGCALAEVLWSGQEQRDWTDFQQRLAVHLRRLDVLGVAYRPESGPLPWQRGGTGRYRRAPVDSDAS